MIESAHNPKIQRVIKLLKRSRERRKTGLYVLEGVRLVEEAYQSGMMPESVFYQPELDERGQQLVSGFKTARVPVWEVSPNVMQKMSGTETPQGLLAIMPMQSCPLPQQASLLVVLDGISDPGNMGTILRTSLAFGADAILLTPGCVDIYAPKVVRAGMGAHLRLPVHSVAWSDLADILSSFNIILAEANAPKIIADLDLRQPVALVIGSEAHGLSKQARNLGGTPARIPMPGNMESLNAAIAASVMLYEVIRQRMVPYDA